MREGMAVKILVLKDGTGRLFSGMIVGETGSSHRPLDASRMTQRYNLPIDELESSIGVQDST